MTIRPQVIKRLFAHSGNRCAFPTCTVPIVDGQTLLGEICHIAAVSSNGPRYDASQTDEARDGFDNLILLCPNHTVIDADIEAYTVELLRKMKRDHEAGVTPIEGEEAANGMVLLFDQSVRNEGQRGGLSAHTVNANSIHFHGDDAAAKRSSEAIEKLWLVILSLKQHFGDVVYLGTILTTDELDRYFKTGEGGRAFDPLTLYRSFEVVSEKMVLSESTKMESERLFVSPRLWSIFFCIQGHLRPHCVSFPSLVRRAQNRRLANGYGHKPASPRGMQTAFDDFNTRDAALAERQNAAFTDAQRFELERMRRILLVKLEATIQGEFSDDFIRQLNARLLDEKERLRRLEGLMDDTLEASRQPGTEFSSDEYLAPLTFAPKRADAANALAVLKSCAKAIGADDHQSIRLAKRRMLSIARGRYSLSPCAKPAFNSGGCRSPFRFPELVGLRDRPMPRGPSEPIQNPDFGFRSLLAKWLCHSKA